MKTNMEGVKNTAKYLCDAVKIEPVIHGLLDCNHPFTNTIFPQLKMGEWVNIMETDNYLKWRKILYSIIDEQDSAGKVLFFVRTPYKLTFLKFARPYIEENEFSELFGDCWCESENPNMDVNVNLRTAISWFKKANPEYLMEEQEREYLASLPDMVTVYRGVSVGRKKLGLSWTDNLKKADWFAQRFGEGYLLKAEIPKMYILAYFDRRNEDELVVDVFEIKDLIQEIHYSNSGEV